MNARLQRFAMAGLLAVCLPAAAVDPVAEAGAESAPPAPAAPVSSTASGFKTYAVPLAPAPAPASSPAVYAQGQAGGRIGLVRAGAVLRDQPTPEGPIALTLIGGGPVELISKVPAPSGIWWYVRSVDLEGWIKEDDLQAGGQ